MRQATIATLLLATLALPAYAAEIKVHPSADRVGDISIVGAIGPDDFEAFKQQADRLDNKLVLVHLESPGGNLIAALAFGEYIRAKRWATSVYDECDSACAAVFLAGTLRYVSPIARVGFHAASKDGQESGVGSAVFGAYMTRLGLGYEAVMWATTASPKDIAYLTPSSLASKSL